MPIAELMHCSKPRVVRSPRRRARARLLALGPAVAATEGHATPEILRVFSRAHDLLGEDASIAEQMTVLWGVHLAYAMAGEHTAARETAEQCYRRRPYNTVAADRPCRMSSCLPHCPPGTSLAGPWPAGQGRARSH